MATRTPAAHRLDDTLCPEHYRIKIEASPSRPRFVGGVLIEAQLTKPARTVWLHARQLSIHQAFLHQPGKGTHQARIEMHPDKQMVALHFPARVAKGPCKLLLEFTGELSPSMHGLYLAQDGPEKALVTQCEASDARAIFPCLDEPAFKAKFSWQVTTDKGLTVLTNGAPQKVRTHGKQVEHTFAPTEKMSTYLAALTIGKLQKGASAKVGKVPCAIYSGVGKAKQTQFALEITKRVLPWYTRYFGRPYVYGKLDQVAVPGFDAGAMENVGAIFYRQSLLLMTPGQTSWGAEKRIAEVVAHEIAHQWFGNLVTMQWWDDLWLNEAFATFMAYSACDAIKPSWRMWEDFLDGKEAALAADALHSTHPIYAPVKSPAEATELFDVITYEKGCAVLRMAEAYLGRDAFMRGIKRYIKSHAFGNARGNDLWAALSRASSKPVTKLMHAWIQKPGFPLVRMAQDKARAGKPTLRFAQERFLAEGTKGARASKAQKWPVPIVITFDAGQGVQQHHALLTKQSERITLPTPKGAELRWAYPNTEATGFFRTQIEDATLRHGLREYGMRDLSPSSKSCVLSDTWALVRSGRTDIGELLLLLDDWGIRERDPIVLRHIAGRLRVLRAAVLDAEDEEIFSHWVRHLGAGHLARLGFAPKQHETPPEAVLRAALVDQLGSTARDAHVLHVATELAEAEAQDPRAVDANLAATVVALSAVSAPAARVAKLVAVYQRRKAQRLAPDLIGRYLAGLCSFERPESVRAVLALTLDGTVPQEQLRSVLGAYLGRRTTAPIAWTFLQKHWKALSPKVGSMGIARLVECCGALPVSHRSEVTTFFKRNPVPEAERALKKALEAMALAEQLRKRAAKPLGRWLASRVVVQKKAR